MTPGRPGLGLVKGERPPVLHRLGTIAGRSCCGKAIDSVPDAAGPKLLVCRRCIAIDKARREGLPDWF